MSTEAPILVAVHDSPGAFRAADVAIGFALKTGAQLHALTVDDRMGPLAAERAPNDPASRERERAAEASLRHVTARAAAAGVPLTVHRRQGRPASCILAEAAALGAGLIVMAVVDHRNQPNPYVGTQTLRVLEFSTVPVLVVPVRPAEPSGR